MSRFTHSRVVGALRAAVAGRPACGAEALEPRRLLAAIASGQTIQATIGVAGEVDDYTFDANAGDAIVAGLSRDGSAIEPRLRILSPTSAVLHDEINTFGLDHVLAAPVSGTYTLRVSESGDNETGAYAVSLARLPGPQTSDGDDGPLTSGQSYLGGITLSDIDVFTFTATAGEKITMGLSRVGSSIEPTLDVFSPAGTNVFTGTTAFGLAADFAVPTGGSYYAVVRDANCDEVGQYRLSFARPFTPTVATPLGSGQWVRGSVDAGQFKLFTFNLAQAGADVRLGASRLDSAIEPRVTVYNAAGQQVSTGVNTFGFDLDFTATLPGQYAAVVGDANADEAGEFGLSVAVGGNAPAVDRGPLISGRQYRGGVEPGMLQAYTFAGTAGDTVTFAASRANSAIEPRIDVFRPDGVKLTSAVNTFGFDLEALLPSTGTYLAVVADATADESGGFYFSFARGSGPQDVGPLFGDPEGGAIQSGIRRSGFVDPGDLDVFTFAADVGDNILLTASRVNSAIEPRIDLYRPDGVKLGSNAGAFSAVVEEIAPLTGTYTAIFRDSAADEAGGYAVSLAIGPHPIAADPADNDGGTLTSATSFGYLTLADTDLYTFTATAGVPFTVRMNRQNGAAIEPTLIIYGPDGARYANSSVSEAVVAVANPPVGGTYLVVAVDGSADEAGGYGITLNTTSPSITDSRAPQALVGSLEHLRTGNVQVQFSEAMQGLTGAAMALNNVTTGGGVIATSVAFDAGTGIGTYTVSGGLPDGNYIGTLSVGTARDLANNPLSAPLNFSFFVLRGDANRDRTVNIADFSILAANFNQLGTFGEGDFNYSGTVDIADFALLGSRFNTSLPPARAPVAGVTLPAADKPFSARLIEDLL